MRKINKYIVSLIMVVMMLTLTGCNSFIENQFGKVEALSNTSSSTIKSEDNEHNVDGELKVIFLDVGQGNSQLIISPSGQTMLIDGGNNGKEELMFKYLKSYSIKKIDVLIGSHPDADHIGTLPEIIDAYDIGSIYLPKASSNTKTYEQLLKSIKRKQLKVKTATSNVKINLDEAMQVELVGPVNTYEDNNNMSAVVKVTFGSASFLFPGDAEYDSELDLLQSNQNLKSNVLAIGHHGSNSSSQKKLLKAVNPEYGVIQVGEDNKYGHPTDKTIRKLKDQNIKILRTDKNGTITFTTDGTSIEVVSEK